METALVMAANSKHKKKATASTCPNENWANT